MTVRLRRSVLYVPASNARAIAKAKTLPVDAVVLDLEDAVAPDAKAGARDAAVAAVRQGGFGPCAVALRINHPGTAWGAADLAAAAAAGPDAVLLPKVERVDTVLAAAGALRGTRTRIWAMVETPAAVADVAAIARAADDPASRLDALVMGTNDLALELRMRVGPGRGGLLPHLAACVLAARRHGLDVLDGVFNALDDPDGFSAECEQGRDFGFDGKTLVHPDQVEPCNRAFTPSPAEVAWAEVVAAAFADRANAGSGALRVGGRMVERLHAVAAVRTLAQAAAAADRNKAASRT